MDETISVILVDDEPLLIESLEIILTLGGEIDVLAKASDGKEALKLLETCQPDVALVDLNMKGMGGIELIPIIKKLYPQIKILVLTTFYDEKNITSAISNGADGYLLKDSGKDAIIRAVCNIAKGQSVLDSKVMEKLSSLISDVKQTSSIESDKRFNELTKRELEICSMISEGYTNAQIASFLYISEGTVKNYISSIYDKTDIHDRAQLAITIKNMK